jgi:predicted dehydrogenase
MAQIKVGVIGLGMMGLTHLDVYSKRSDVKIVAISDILPDRLTGKVRAVGNIQGQAQGGFDYNSARQHDEGMKLIADKEVDLVDICLPTPLHHDYALKALKKGKHVLVEKPLARTAKEAAHLAKAAGKANKLSMCGMCMRFWPGWTWLKDVVEKGTYGKVFAAQFRRVASHPGGPFYSDGEKCGGAMLDLHIHDTDFIQYCFGIPTAVTTAGYNKTTSHPDHVITRYHYDHIPLLTAEGGWVMSPGFPFVMQYTVNFERATAVFDLSAPKPLMLYEGGKGQPVELEPGMGYEREIAYFLNCIATGQSPSIVTLESAAKTVKIVEAEGKSLASGKTVKVKL